MIRRRNAHDGVSPAVLWWIRDWLTSETVLAMPRDARSLYHDLLLRQALDGSISSDVRVLAAVSGETPKSFAKMWKHVGPQFKPGEDGRLRNPRMQRELDDAAEYRKRKADAGRAGNEKRWHEHRETIAQRSNSDPSANGLGVPKASPSSSSSSSSSPSESPPTPRKRGKREASSEEVDAGFRDAPRLDTPECRAGWSRWMQHRREIGKPVTPTSAHDAIGCYRERGPTAFLEAIEHTIARGWQGLRDPSPEDRAGLAPTKHAASKEPPDAEDIRSRWMIAQGRKVRDGLARGVPDYPGYAQAKADLCAAARVGA